MIPRAGTFPWLVAHDTRQSWRRFTDMFGGLGTRNVILILVGVSVLLHALAWPVARIASPYLHGEAVALAPLAGLLACIFTWMIAQSLFGATRTLYDRGDLDLLLGSPIPSGRVLSAKAVAIAGNTLGSIAFLILPVANAGALSGEPAWLAVYPTLVALVLVATSLAIGIAVAMFFAVGPRRARTMAQLTGAGIAGVVVLGAQIFAILPDTARQALARTLNGGAEPVGLTAFALAPVRALQGDFWAIAGLLLLGVVLFATVARFLADRFATASLAAAGAPARENTRVGRSSPATFRTGCSASLRRKEWRLLLRDPQLFAQLGLQIVYTIPLTVVLLRSGMLPTAFAIAPTIVVVAAQVAASLAWLTVSGEDAPELIASAPVTATAVDRAKLSAIIPPVFAIIALPLAGLALVSWRLALMTALFAAAGGASTALVNLWHPMPGNRRGMLRRHSQSKVMALVEHAFAIIWAIAIVLAFLGSGLVLVPVLLSCGILWFCRGGMGVRGRFGSGVRPASRGETAAAQA